MTLPSSPTARQSIIREMMAFAVAPSTRAVGSLPAPRLNPARCLDTGTATATDAQAPAEPLTALGLASAPLGDGGQVEEQGTPPTTPSLSSALSLRGPTWPLASDTEVLLEAQLGAFTSLVGPGRSDWRRITPSAFLGITLDAARDEHFYIGPADLPSTWALIVHSRTLLHPKHTTSVTVVALRKWRPYLRTAAGPLAFPAEGPGDHRRFRLRGQTKAACPSFDTWHLTLSPPAHVEQQALSSMRRDERLELDRRLAAGRQGEVFDGGRVGLNAKLLRRAHDPRERTYPMPGSAPHAAAPRELAAGDPYRLSSPIPPPGTPPISYALTLDEDELRYGRVGAAMRRMPEDLAALQSELRRERIAWDRLRKTWWPMLWDVDPTSDEPNPIPKGGLLEVRRFYTCPSSTERRFPSCTWHLDDHTVDAHDRRCLALSRIRFAAAAAGLAARAAACARRGARASTQAVTDVLGHLHLDVGVEEEYTVRDCLDECERPHAPIDPHAMEELHLQHCPLCRRAAWQPTGCHGIAIPGGIRHNSRCYFHRHFLGLVFGLWYPWDPIGTEICGGSGGAPVPDAARADPQPYWHKSVMEHPEAAAAGLRKWDVVPYATRPVFDIRTLKPLGDFVGTYVPGYDLAVHPVRGPDGNLQPPRTLQIKVTFKSRDDWMHRVHGSARVPRVVSALNFNHNDHCRRARFQYSGTDFVCENVRPKQEGAVDDLTSAFPHIPLAHSRRETQVYRDPVNNQWRALVNYGFGSRISPYYCSAHSTELVSGIRGEAQRCVERWDHLLEHELPGTSGAPSVPGDVALVQPAPPTPSELIDGRPATDVTPATPEPPYLVTWLKDGGSINAYVDDLMNLARQRNGVSIAGHVQTHTKTRARLLRWAISERKSQPPSTTFTYLGLEYCTLMATGSGEWRVEVRMIFERRQQTEEILRYILGRGRVSRDDMDSLIGQIEWVAHIMRGGRSHLARLLSFRRRCKHDSNAARRSRSWEYEYPLDGAARTKFEWFADQVAPGSGWSGTRMLRLANEDYLLWYSDAAGQLGWGTYLVPRTATPPSEVEMHQAPWTPEQAKWPSFAQEMHPAKTVLARSFELRGADCLVVFTTDNSGTVMALNKNRTQYEPAYALMEEISDLERKTGIDLIARWADRGRNIVADELSRQRTMTIAWEAHCAAHGGDPSLVSGMDSLTYGDAVRVFDACRLVQVAARRLGRWARRLARPRPDSGARTAIEAAGRRIVRWWRATTPPGSTTPAGTYRLADCFAGVCGFSHGFELARLDQPREARTVLSFEGCTAASKVSKANRLSDDHGVHQLILDESNVGYVGRALRRARIDILVGSPPCQDYHTGHQVNAHAGSTRTSARATAGRLMTRAAIDGGVNAVAFENSPGYVDSQVWRDNVADLEEAGFTVTHAMRVDSGRLPGAAPQSRTRSVTIGVRGATADINGAYAAVAAPLQPVHDHIPGKWHHQHPFVRSDPAVRSSALAARSLRTNTCEVPGFDEPPGHVPLGWPTDGDDVHVFTTSQKAWLQGFPDSRVWPAHEYFCKCTLCHRPHSKYNMRAVGRQIGNAVPSSLGRFVGAVILPLLPAPRGDARLSRPSPLHAGTEPAAALPPARPARSTSGGTTGGTGTPGTADTPGGPCAPTADATAIG